MKYFLFIIFSALRLSVASQNMHETGRSTFICIQGGPSKFLGDIGGVPNSFINKFSLGQNTYFFGGCVQKFYEKKASLEFGINTGKLSATDADIKYNSIADPEYLRFRRNLDFRTTILEASINFHIYPFQFLRKSSKLYKAKLQPFLYGGIGYFTFNPQGSIYDPAYKTTIWQDLKPLRTEGQGYTEYPERKEYSLQQINMPHGFGITYFVAENFFISISMNGRKLFTDYIDDVSTNYIDTKLHQRYIGIGEEADQAILYSDKTPLIDPFFKNNIGDIRGNPLKQDSFFNYNIKIGLRIARKKSKKHTYYKFDETEKCD